MKIRHCLIIAAMTVSTAVPVNANICAHDAVPAATLLFPFVSFDYNSTSSVRPDLDVKPYRPEDTILTITNVSDAAQVVRVTLWSDLSMAVLDFNILLVGYDVQRISIRDILIKGQLPVTVTEVHTAIEGVHDFGPVSSWNELNPDWISGLMAEPTATSGLGDRCTPEHSGYPGNYTTLIPQAALDLIRMFLTISQSVDRFVSDDCTLPYTNPYVSAFYPDSWFEFRDTSTPTWMYVTADVVESCATGGPADLDYWLPGENGGEARYDNVLTGDLRWTAGRNTTAMQAVHLEADRDLAEVTTQGNTGLPVSFYARYSNLNDNVSDFREPLPTSWAVRYTGADVQETDTRLLLWKGSTRFATPLDLEFSGDPVDPTELVASNCMAYTYYSWDEDSNIPTGISIPGWGPPDCSGWPYGAGKCSNRFPLAVQEVSIDQLSTVDENGWMLFVWPASNYDVPGAPPTPDLYQTWMGVLEKNRGMNDILLPGTVMGNYNCFSDQVLPELGVNYDYVPSPTKGR